MIVGVTDQFQAPFDVESAVLGENVDFIEIDAGRDGELDPGALAKVDALLVFHASITAATIDRLENCKIVVRYGVGVDNIDLAGLASRGLPLCNTPDYGVEEIAASASAHLLNLWRRISAFDRSARWHKGGWSRNILGTPVGRISESTLGVVGTGRIGAQLISYMKPYGTRILGFDPDKNSEYARKVGYEPVATLDELLMASDAVSLHCVLVEKTKGLVNDAFIKAMKPGALLVNTARGRLFESLDVLERGLRSGQLGGLGTDVLPDEPPFSGDKLHPLIRDWKNDADWLNGRLSITPHVAYYSDAAVVEMRRKAAETIKLFMESGTLRNQVI